MYRTNRLTLEGSRFLIVCSVCENGMGLILPVPAGARVGTPIPVYIIAVKTAELLGFPRTGQADRGIRFS